MMPGRMEGAGVRRVVVDRFRYYVHFHRNVAQYSLGCLLLPGLVGRRRVGISLYDVFHLGRWDPLIDQHVPTDGTELTSLKGRPDE
jgi:hypothetical protein